jgi:hyperosmotically inducible periplasmic protein
MVRALLKLVVLTGVLAAAGGYLAGWWDGRDVREAGERAVATTGVDTSRAREVAVQVKDRTSEAAHETRKVLSDSSLTAKIKAKMALDDHVKAFDLNIDTSAGVATVSGRVRTDSERKRALELARDTEGITKVVDRIQVRR